jgi:hypothetical protein
MSGQAKKLPGKKSAGHVEAGLSPLPRAEPAHRTASKNSLREAKYCKVLAYIVNMRPHLVFSQLAIVMISDAAQG